MARTSAVFLSCAVLLAGAGPAAPAGGLAAQNAAIKYVYAIDYPVGQKDAYLAWVRTVAETLQGPPEVRRLASYDAYFGASPQRVIEFEFDSLPAAARYFARREVQRTLDEIVNRGVNSSVAVLSLRSDYRVSTAGHSPIKYVFLIDYPLGKKDAYLAWVATVAGTLQGAPGITRLQAYDNYFGASPHRVVEFEFASLEAAAAYFARPGIARVFEDVVNYGTNAGMWVLQLRSDYATR